MTAFVIISLLILLNAMFVAAEFAIVAAPRAAVEASAARGNTMARAVLRVLRDPQRQDRYIATAQLGITVASLGLGMYGEHVLADGIFTLLGESGLPAWIVSHTLASVLAVACLTYFHIVVGEMVPKSLALQYAERMALWITPPMSWLTTLLFPGVVALNGIGNVLLRLMGINRQQENVNQYYTSEELQFIVRESEERGALRAESGQMLQELFEFGELTAGEVMVPRVRIAGIPLGSGADRIREIIARTPHTRYPIVEQDLDHITGMIHIKDLLRLLLRRESCSIAHARPVPLVPETARMDHVLATMRKERSQMVVVLDEHGGTSGIVTLEDLFEEVIGEVGEDPSESDELPRDAAGRLLVAGTMRVDELGQLFDLDLEHEDVDSVSGLVLTLLGRPPQVGDVVTYERLRLEVTALQGHGVGEAAVTLAA